MVTWTLKARRRLRSLLARWLCPTDPMREHATGENDDFATRLAARLGELELVLREVFRDGEHIIVQDVLLGYRRHENRYVFLVEVAGGGHPGGHVVKIGPAEKLQQELKAWDSCRPEGLEHDLVLLPLTLGYLAPGENPDRWMALHYGAAHQLIGVEFVTMFEDAAITSILHGWPMLESIGVVLWELYERLGHTLLRPV